MNIFIKVAPRYYERLQVKSPTSLPPVRRSTRRRELITLSRVLFEGYNIPCDETKHASFSKQPSNPAPRLSATLRKSLGSPDATDSRHDVKNAKGQTQVRHPERMQGI
jgi:hypothetical protein